MVSVVPFCAGWKSKSPGDSQTGVPLADLLEVDLHRVVDVAVVPLRVREAGGHQPHSGQLLSAAPAPGAGLSDRLPGVTMRLPHPAGRHRGHAGSLPWRGTARPGLETLLAVT